MTYQDMQYGGYGVTNGANVGTQTALIVDDCIVTRQLLESMLRNTPVQVLGAAETIEDAKRLVASLRPDMLFVDMLVLGKNASEALDNLRRTAPGIKTVLSTTRVHCQSSSSRYLPEADAYLMRPYHRDRVAERVQGLCEREATPVSCG